MAVYRNVQVNFWQDEFILDLTPEERYFYIYLLTGTKTKQCGIYILPKRVAELETGYSMETVEKLLNRFVAYGKILYDAETKELYILNWLHYNPILNTNVEKCVLRELKTVKNKEFIHTFLRKCLEEEWKIPLLLQHFGMPEEEDTSSLQEVIEEKEVESIEEAVPNSKVYKFYEQHISSLSPYIVKELKDWIQRVSGKVVLEALKIAFEHNKRTFAYVKGILRNWCKKGQVDLSEEKEGFILYDP
ncbi:DnaD and phage-associated domain-containing protein [Bacillus toyonensis]|uniref:DnaD domain-containing protein n=1 Tax=Bacillus TaxID=1386 RepID=UPI0001A0BFC4|nr:MULTISPECIES: DnaD domain protein [Bacillus cereus group]EEL39590.1 DnaD domain protein [Bacillus cereus Rock3-29]KAB0447563.1 DnaD domain protein [Lysinibacillus sp. VIA-II-2016]EJQ37835.1 DnaD and phage-associated domain-containing protein [Bacillus toyonensis]EJQ81038.1 DnaD and phage-associated domain-containing protein [Bacillus toyonensis]EJV48294.1 DnaD and phage-associated domain-containing protein [Bacillus toyonensis]